MRSRIENVLWSVCTETRPTVSDKAIRALLAYPTNRLESVLSAAAKRCAGGVIEECDLDLPMDPLLPVKAAPIRTAPPIPMALPTLELKALEKTAISDALRVTRGNRTHAAEILGIGLRTLRAKLSMYRITGVDGEHFASRQPS